MSGLRIAPMTLGDLQVAVDWAAAEGWNPGLGDAEAFHAVDPAGFLMGWLGATPVTAISVVRHADSFGFLGFYLCRPEHRGQGFGLATWEAGMAHLGQRTVGLDGVPAQQANYARSGFAFAHRTQRHRGRIAGAASPACRKAGAEDLPALLALDRAVGGTARDTYLSAWFRGTPTRRTMVLERDGRIAAVGTIRRCREGHKIGPLIAPDAAVAEELIRALADAAGAEDVSLDIPDPNAGGVALAGRLGLVPAFACARMYRGRPLVRDLGRIFGEMSFELG